MNDRKLEGVIGYSFKDEKILKRALTHSSYLRDSKEKNGSNERLEFLGDAYLDAFVSEILFLRNREIPEGQLSKLRAMVVCEKSLAEVGRKIGLGSYLNMGKGEVVMGGRDRDSIIADGVEALIAAIYLDGGFQAAFDFVRNNLSDSIEAALEGKLSKDYKSQLQERLQKSGELHISYEVLSQEGPDHRKTFRMGVYIDGKLAGEGQGKSKKEAEQQAACAALKKAVL